MHRIYFIIVYTLQSSDDNGLGVTRQTHFTITESTRKIRGVGETRRVCSWIVPSFGGGGATRSLSKDGVAEEFRRDPTVATPHSLTRDQK